MPVFRQSIILQLFLLYTDWSMLRDDAIFIQIDDNGKDYVLGCAIQATILRKLSICLMKENVLD